MGSVIAKSMKRDFKSGSIEGSMKLCLSREIRLRKEGRDRSQKATRPVTLSETEGMFSRLLLAARSLLRPEITRSPCG